jgi:excinuclease ABC subunit A
VIEHDMQVIASCDWVIDIGPGAGDEGGRIIAQGPPEEIVSAHGSRTVPYLAEYLPGRRQSLEVSSAQSPSRSVQAV